MALPLTLNSLPARGWQGFLFSLGAFTLVIAVLIFAEVDSSWLSKSGKLLLIASPVIAFFLAALLPLPKKKSYAATVGGLFSFLLCGTLFAIHKDPIILSLFPLDLVRLALRDPFTYVSLWSFTLIFGGLWGGLMSHYHHVHSYETRPKTLRVTLNIDPLDPDATALTLMDIAQSLSPASSWTTPELTESSGFRISQPSTGLWFLMEPWGEPTTKLSPSLVHGMMTEAHSLSGEVNCVIEQEWILSFFVLPPISFLFPKSDFNPTIAAEARDALFNTLSHPGSPLIVHSMSALS